MTNNDILKKIRYAFEMRDPEMVKIFQHKIPEMSRSWLSLFFKEENDAEYKAMDDDTLFAFLDGLILERRGPRE